MVNSVFKEPIWKRLRVSPSLNGLTKWEESPPKGIRIYIVSTVKTKVILWRITGHCSLIDQECIDSFGNLIN